MNTRDHFRPVQLRHIVMIWTHHVEHFMQALFDFEMPEGRLLWLLAQAGPATATQLCGLAYMRKFQVSRSLAKLRELGYVTMVQNPDDQRSEIVQLTDSGVACNQLLLRYSLKWADLLEQQLTPSESKALESALAKMQANAEHLGPVVEADLAAVKKATAQKANACVGKGKSSPQVAPAAVPTAKVAPARRRTTTPRRLHLR
jgi:DNA-binding MarR family transcriptional regulator